MSLTFIYALCDPMSFKVRYIGKSNNPYKRYCYHLLDKDHTHKVCWIQSLLKKAYNPILQIIEQCDETIWQERERVWIKFYKTLGHDLTNLTDGGDGNSNPTEETLKKMSESHIGKHPTEETREKLSKVAKRRMGFPETRKRLSEANKGQIPWIKGKHHSEEVKTKISEAGKGKARALGTHWSVEAKRKKSESTRGNNNIFYGKHHSEEAKRKISEANKGNKFSLGRHLSEETIRKRSETRKKKRNHF